MADTNQLLNKRKLKGAAHVALPRVNAGISEILAQLPPPPIIHPVIKGRESQLITKQDGEKKRERAFNAHNFLTGNYL